jgi:tRNA(Ile)-lysidine synthase TilS/MesJ
MKYVVEDETNAISRGSRRNMLRNEIVPILERDKVGLETIIAKKMEKRLMLELLK